jgi:hypothetical protein
MSINLEFVVPPNEVCTGAYFAAASIGTTPAIRPKI